MTGRQCEACDKAEAEAPSLPLFTAGCLSCAARSIVALGIVEGVPAKLRRMLGADWRAGKAEFDRWSSIFRQFEARLEASTVKKKATR